MKASAFLEQPQDEGHDGHDHKYEEEDLGNTYGTRRDATEAEDGSDECDNQKNNCVMQHFHLPVSSRVSADRVAENFSAWDLL